MQKVPCSKRKYCVLQYTADCSALKYISLQWSALQCTVFHYSALDIKILYASNGTGQHWTQPHRDAVYCPEIYFIAINCHALHCISLECTKCDNTLCNLWHWTALCAVAQRCSSSHEGENDISKFAKKAARCKFWENSNRLGDKKSFDNIWPEKDSTRLQNPPFFTQPVVLNQYSNQN